METTPEPIQQLEAALRTVTQDRRIVGHFGAVEIDGQPSSWWYILYDDSVTRLIASPEYKVAQILSVLGSEVRLAILRHLLPGPKTAGELVTDLGLSTTGQAYHHLRELERAGYVQQRAGGRYHFDMKRGRIYLIALALAADGGAEEPEEPSDNKA